MARPSAAPEAVSTEATEAEVTATVESEATMTAEVTAPGAREYELALDKAMIAVAQGDDVQQTLDQLAAEWDAITEKKGIESQKEAYQIWRQLPNAYADGIGQ